MMVWLKCCPRCIDGDLSEEMDLYGEYVICLQCGYYLTDGEQALFRYPSPVKTGVHSRERTASVTATIGKARQVLQTPLTVA